MKRKIWLKQLTLLAFLLAAGLAPLQAQDSQKELPWYFPAGVVQSNDSVVQKQEYLRYYAASRKCFQGDDHSPDLIPGNDSIRVPTDQVSTDSMTENPAHLVLVFDHWVYTGDDVLRREAKTHNISFEEAKKQFRVRVTTMCEQRFITQHQFEVARDDLLAQAKIAADNDFSYYKDVERKAVAARALELGVSEVEFRKYLDEKVQDTDITYREMNLLPKPYRRSDFVPREIHLAPSPEIEGILGVQWLDTGIVYYNPQGRVRDYLVGRPGVLQHEIIHGNTNMQEWPMQGFDHELFASIPEMLDLENTIDLFGHGYAQDLREWIETYFGFDFAQARKEVYSFNLGGQIIINETKYREYVAKLTQVQAVLLPFFEDKVIPEFYSKRAWWTAMNGRRSDNNTVVEVMLADNFDPVMLEGHQQTMLWLKANEEKIRMWARKAFEKTKEDPNGGGTDSGMRPSQSYMNLYNDAFTPAEQQELNRRCSADKAGCKALLADPQKLIEYLKNFKANAAKGGGQ